MTIITNTNDIKYILIDPYFSTLGYNSERFVSSMKCVAKNVNICEKTIDRQYYLLFFYYHIYTIR